MDNNLFGWELFFKISKKSIHTKSELLVSFVHFCIVRQNALCLGCGNNSNSTTKTEQGSELLPDGWNKNEKKWTLRYTYKDSVYVLFGSKFENLSIFNFLNVKENKSFDVAIDEDVYIKALEGPIEDMIPNYLDLIHEINSNLFDTISARNTKTTSAQTDDPPKQLQMPRSHLLIPRMEVGNPLIVRQVRNVELVPPQHLGHSRGHPILRPLGVVHTPLSRRARSPIERRCFADYLHLFST